MAESDIKNPASVAPKPTAVNQPIQPAAPSVKGFRTLKGDMADLVSKNEAAKKALSKLDSRLGKQVEQYIVAGGDQKVAASITSRQSKTSNEEAITPEGLPFVIRKIREAHGDVDDDHLSREAIVNEIEKDYSDGGDSGNEVIDLGGESDRPAKKQVRVQVTRSAPRTVQGVTSFDKNGASGSMRTLEGEQVYEETPLSDGPQRAPAAPVQVELKINHEDTREPAPRVIYVEREPAPSAPIPAATPTTPTAKVPPVAPPKPSIQKQTPPPPPPRPAPKVEVRHEIKFTPTPPTGGLEEEPKKEPAPTKPAATVKPPEPSPVPKVTVSETKPEPKPTSTSQPKPPAASPAPAKTSFTPTPLSAVYSSIKPEPKTSSSEKSGEKEKPKEIAEKTSDQDTARAIDGETLDEKIADIEAKIAESDANAAETKRSTEEMNAQRASIQSSLDPIIAKEKEVEAEENALDAELDRTADPATKREIEGRRWQFEDERQKIEKDRWSVEQDLVTLDGKLKELSRQQEKNTRDKKALVDKLEIAKAKKAAAAARIERADVARQLAEVKETEKSLEAEWKTLHGDYEKSEHSLNILLKQEEDVRSDIRRISTREDQTSRPEERHKLEEERWKKEADRKNVEESELSAEEEASKSESLIADLQDKFQKVKSDELALTAKLKELDAIITKAGV